MDIIHSVNRFSGCLFMRQFFQWCLSAGRRIRKKIPYFSAFVGFTLIHLKIICQTEKRTKIPCLATQELFSQLHSIYNMVHFILLFLSYYYAEIIMVVVSTSLLPLLVRSTSLRTNQIEIRKGLKEQRQQIQMVTAEFFLHK